MRTEAGRLQGCFGKFQVKANQLWPWDGQEDTGTRNIWKAELAEHSGFWSGGWWVSGCSGWVGTG